MCSVTRPGFYWLQNGCQQQRLQESTQTNTHEPLPVAAESNGLTNLPSLSPLCGSPSDFSPALTNPVYSSQWHPAWLQHCLMPSCLPCGLDTLSSLVHVVFPELVSPGFPLQPPQPPETLTRNVKLDLSRAALSTPTEPHSHPAIGRPLRLPAAVAHPRHCHPHPSVLIRITTLPAFEPGH